MMLLRTLSAIAEVSVAERQNIFKFR